MGGKKCIVCGNASKPHFEFPSETNVRTKWLEAVARFCDISKITDYSVLCKNHFQEEHLKNLNNRFRLTKGAVPILSVDILLKDEDDNHAEDRNIVETDSKSIQVESLSANKMKDLQYHNKILSLKLKRLQEKNLANLLKLKHFEETESQNFSKINLVNKIFNDAENSDVQAIFLADLIKNYSKKTSRWSETSVRMCSLWRYRSPKGYAYCRSRLLQLPSRATMSRYRCQFNGPNK